MKIDGRKVATDILQELKKRVELLKERGIVPTLAIILVGNDPSSLSYIRQKEIKAKEIGAIIQKHLLPEHTPQKVLLGLIEELNIDRKIHGIIVQLPLPSQFNESTIIQSVDLNKDIDGFLPNSPYSVPVALAIVRLIAQAGVDRESMENKKIVVVGKGHTAGKPIIDHLQKVGIVPTVIDSQTLNPSEIQKTADIIISAAGRYIVKPENLKKGVILIDVGMRTENGKLKGDYEDEEIQSISSFYTPTPGGVGPVNVAYLLQNLVTAAENSA